MTGVDRGAVDLAVPWRGHFRGCCLALSQYSGSRMIVGRRDAVLWEAGANPALPRNCKRGQRDRSLGMSENDDLGRPVAATGCWAKAQVLTRKARRPA